MATYSKVLPSASADGMPLKITQTVTAGTVFHTAHATSIDEIWMWLTNTDTVERVVTIEFGDVIAPDRHIVVTVPARDTIKAVGGQTLTNSRTIRAFCAAANVVNMVGFVNRITP